MPTPDVEQKLTPAARQVLSDMMTDYKDQLLLAAKDSAERLTGELREISVHDLLRGYAALNSRPVVRGNTVDRLLTFYTAIGLLLGAGGLLTYGFQISLQRANIEEQLPLLFGLTGFFFAAVAFVYQRLRTQAQGLRHRRRSLETQSIQESIGAVVSEWNDLELALRKVALAHFGESLASAPLSKLIDALGNVGVLNQEDALRLRDLLRVRNEAVHGGRGIDAEKATKLAREAERILTKLQTAAPA